MTPRARRLVWLAVLVLIAVVAGIAYAWPAGALVALGGIAAAFATAPEEYLP